LARTYEYCKDCGAELEAEFVDIGIGYEQVTQGECPNNCGYIEWMYQEYVKDNKNPLPLEEWIKQHEVKE
jgi:hypothetical protein